MFSLCNFAIPYSRCVVEFYSPKVCFFCDRFGFEQVVNKFIDIFGCGYGWVGFKVFVSFLIIQHFVNLVVIPLVA